MTYPFTKTPATVFEVIDGVTNLNGALFQKFSDATIRIEDELGIKPSGTYASVRARLDAMEVVDDEGNAGPHSTQIATHFRHNWISPEIPTGLGFVTLPTVIGQVPINLTTDVGFSDGYGLVYFTNRFFVDIDVEFTFELWEITDTPTQLTTQTFTFGEHTYSVVVALPLDENENKVYELRCENVSAAGSIVNINSILWNSRFTFIPSNPTPVTNELSFMLVDFDITDVIAGELSIGDLGSNHVVQSVSVLINTGFNGGTTMEVGDDLDQNRLMGTGDNIPGVVDTYTVTSDILYAGTSELKMYFTGAPTTGSGRVIVYFH